MRRSKMDTCMLLLMTVLFCALCIGTFAQTTPTQKREMIFAIWADARGSNFTNHARAAQMIATLRAARFNTVLLQVRQDGDAYYVSDTEPRASGIEPGYRDPLADIIPMCHSAEASARMKILPWFTMLRAFTADVYPTPPLGNVMQIHPDWLSEDANGNKQDESKSYYLDPGVPPVRDYLTNVVLEVVQKYDVDGVHLAGLAYPEKGINWGYNPIAVARFNEETNHSGKPLPDDPSWCQWRRDQITAIVKAISEAVRAAKPDVIVTVSAETAGEAPRSAEDFKQSAIYTQRLQDWLAWVDQGLVDVIYVKTFFQQPNERQQFEQWTNFALAHKATALGCIGVSGEMNFTDPLVQQMRFIRSNDLADGMALWSYKSPTKEDHGILFKLLGTAIFAEDYVGVQKPRIPQYVPPPPLKVEERLTSPALSMAAKLTTPTVAITLPERAEGRVTSPTLAIETMPTTPTLAVETPLAETVIVPVAVSESLTTPTVPSTLEIAKEATPPPTPAPTPEFRIPPPPQKTWDTIYLTNGSSFEGKVIDEVQGKAVIETSAGLKMIIPISSIKKIVKVIE
jgi:uncharacterized lipoprotein YddW (UPF0748 family)